MKFKYTLKGLRISLQGLWEYQNSNSQTFSFTHCLSVSKHKPPLKAAYTALSPFFKISNMN